MLTLRLSTEVYLADKQTLYPCLWNISGLSTGEKCQTKLHKPVEALTSKSATYIYVYTHTHLYILTAKVMWTGSLLAFWLCEIPSTWLKCFEDVCVGDKLWMTDLGPSINVSSFIQYKVLILISKRFHSAEPILLIDSIDCHAHIQQREQKCCSL